MDTMSKDILSRKKCLSPLKNTGFTKSRNFDIIHPMDSTHKIEKSIQKNSQDSQNFTLRLSDSICTNDTSENSENFDDGKKSDPEIIEISDSTDDECLRVFNKNKSNHRTGVKIQRYQSSPISISSVDSVEILPDNEKKMNDQTRLKSMSLLTSDESCADLINFRQATNDVNHAKDVLTTPRRVPVPQNQTDSGYSRRNEGDNGKQCAKTHLNELSVQNSIKLSTRTTPLTKKDTRNIMKAIKSKCPIYKKRSGDRKNTIVSDSDSDCTATSSKASLEGKKVRHPAWISETESEESCTEKEDILISRENEIKNSSLSDRKKQEIARWIMTNSSDTQSDTSFIPPSEANSFNSGNSSLERLEENYETPNNRDKYRSNIYKTPEPRQISTSVRLVQTVKIPKISSIQSKITPKLNTKCYTPSTAPIKSKKSVIQIDDCADVLDELYGSSWRNKADILLPKTCKKNNITNDQSAKNQDKKKISSSEFCFDNTSDFNSVIKKLPKKSTVKKVKKPSQQKIYDSFINDDSSAASDNDESTFFTAMTTPIDPKKNIKKTPPMSAAARRAIEICDSDTENDDVHTPIKKISDNRRRLSFSDNKSNTDTSEYDPTDIIPPKLVSKSGKLISNQLIRNRNLISSKCKSFLASLSSTVPLEEAHRDAKIYRLNFQKNKINLCQHLYKLYNEKIFEGKLPDDMSIEWNVRMRGTAGYCYNKTKKTALRGIERSSRIVLATKILDAPDRVRDTLVHEMCHAATWLINQVSDGHGPFWQTWASKAMKAFPELPPIRRCHDYKISTKFTYRCTSCGYSVGRHSKSLDTTKKRCGHCFGTFELLVNKTTKSGVVQVKASSTKQPTAFALFVKNNYQSVKKDHQANGHKEALDWEVMLID